MALTNTGSCLCGAVTFRTHGPLRGVVYCHCSQCRKQTGHFFAATNVSDDCIEVAGGDMLHWYAASAKARRGFCRNCGSALFWKHKELDYVSVLAGAFNPPTGSKASATSSSRTRATTTRSTTACRNSRTRRHRSKSPTIERRRRHLFIESGRLFQ